MVLFVLSKQNGQFCFDHDVNPKDLHQSFSFLENLWPHGTGKVTTSPKNAS